MSRQVFVDLGNTSDTDTEIKFIKLTSKTGSTVPVACYTTLIGQGRSAKVYEAEVPHQPDEKFVIRITKSKLFPTNTILFAFEAVVASGLSGDEKNPVHITLLKKGKDLEKHLREIQQHPRSDQEIYRLAIAVARATYELHRRDVAHRDIKPANFVLMPDGRVLMVDPDLAESNIKTPSQNSKWGTHVYWRNADTKEEADLWALLRTSYVPPRLECQQIERQHSDENAVMTTKLYERTELQSLPSDNYLCGVIPDSFFTNNQRSKLRERLSTETLESTERFQSVGELLCGLILSRYHLFEIFNKVPTELEKLILTYQDRDPECAQLASPEVRRIIEKMAKSSTPDTADVEKLKELLLSAPYASHSVGLFRKPSETPSDKKATPLLQAKL